MGTVSIILKDASADSEFCELLVGVKYGSDGATITEFAIIVGGGKLKVDQTPGLSNTAATVDLRVVIGTGILTHHRGRRRIRSKEAANLSHKIITHAIRVCAQSVY